MTAYLKLKSKFKDYFSQKEKDYIKRVAGKVPTSVIAQQINRKPKHVANWASRNHISLRVPLGLKKKYWSCECQIEQSPDNKVDIAGGNNNG